MYEVLRAEGVIVVADEVGVGEGGGEERERVRVCGRFYGCMPEPNVKGEEFVHSPTQPRPRTDAIG